ncbi:MAG: ABC transporter substrate-binding protein [Pseudomonas sp.]
MLRGLALGAATLSSPALQARSQLLDISANALDLQLPARRIVLGDGPLAYVVALLQEGDPFRHIVGWADNFRAADLDGYQAFSRRFPYIDSIPTFRGSNVGAIDAELALSLQPDVVVLNLSSQAAAQSSGFSERLQRAGVPLLYVDFRTQMQENTEQSLRIIGALLGQSERAEAFISMRRQHLQLIHQRLLSERSRPRVMIERAAGLYDDCCLSYGDGNFGQLLEAAGARNIAKPLLHGAFGTLHPEQVIASEPDVILVTGANWSLYSPAGDWVNLGPGADPNEGRQRLQRLMQRPAYRSLEAVRAGRVYAIWHPFYDHPCHFIALQRIAKWLHPTLFHDLDPDATFAQVHQRFLPLPYQPGYWLNLERYP